MRYCLLIAAFVFAALTSSVSASQLAYHNKGDVKSVHSYMKEKRSYARHARKDILKNLVQARKAEHKKHTRKARKTVHKERAQERIDARKNWRQRFYEKRRKVVKDTKK